MKLPSPKIQPKQPQSMDELYATLNPDERAFFDHLDKQLDKVETFYSAREQEATRRFSQLKDQLNALAEHRRIFHEQFPGGQHEWESKVGRVTKNAHVPILAKAVQHLHGRNPFHNHTDDENAGGSGANSANGGNGANGTRRRSPAGMPGASNGNTPSNGGTAYSTAVSSVRQPEGGSNGSNGSGSEGSSGDNDLSGTTAAGSTRVLLGKPKQFDPERYQKYKKELRTAVVEYYRQLELIKNYRILNLTGFRKALKKFEKVTGIHCLDLYTDERIAPCSFSRGEPIDQLLKQTEELFSEHFEHGDFKKARQKLRGQDAHSTHYQTVFRSGTYIGLGLPAAVLAIVQSFHPDVRQQLPQWGALLCMYGGLYLPVLFGMLFELNLDAWVEARINYEFVMELNRPVLDYRSYLEIPAFLFLTLSYCFFFSFYFIHLPTVAPTTWPLAWLVFAVAFFLNPLPIFRRRARYWLLRVLFRVITPGISRVEFIAFFMADELNSLTYSIQNIMFIACCFGKHWPGNVSAVCPIGTTWPYALLATLAPLSRLIQCLKRWYDSRLWIHLINAGKYCSTIIVAWLYMNWRAGGSDKSSAAFAVWVLFACLNSIYTSSWDLVVDWSLLRPGFKGLRPDLAFGWPGFYYFAMVTNVLIRFIWIWYIPDMKRLSKFRSWLFALLEMIRRWQWNFCEYPFTCSSPSVSFRGFTGVLPGRLARSVPADSGSTQNLPPPFTWLSQSYRTSTLDLFHHRPLPHPPTSSTSFLTSQIVSRQSILAMPMRTESRGTSPCRTGARNRTATSTTTSSRPRTATCPSSGSACSGARRRAVAPTRSMWARAVMRGRESMRLLGLEISPRRGIVRRAWRVCR